MRKNFISRFYSCVSGSELIYRLVCVKPGAQIRYEGEGLHGESREEFRTHPRVHT
jgi:hypothetical protein